MTVHSIARISDDPELVNMDPDIEIWHCCCVDGTVYHCKESQRRNSTRLNYLAWIDQQIDLNAHFSYKRRPENMAPRLFMYSFNSMVSISLAGNNRWSCTVGTT